GLAGGADRAYSGATDPRQLVLEVREERVDKLAEFTSGGDAGDVFADAPGGVGRGDEECVDGVVTPDVEEDPGGPDTSPVEVDRVQLGPATSRPPGQPLQPLE